MSMGITQLRAEMARQFQDASASYKPSDPMAKRIAQTIRSKGRLLLLGMGGSHWINRAASPYYAQAGIDVSCHILSEYMRAPLAGEPAMVLTSQSGASGEIARFLDLGLASDASFGLTLGPDSPLACRLPALVGVGGPETAYAATRSYLVALAQHGAILHNLGLDVGPFKDMLLGMVAVDARERQRAIDHIASCDNGVMVARGNQQGIMDAAALCLMEIARLPVLGLEAGQFRHGPFEMVGSKTALVMLRGPGPVADDLANIAQECVTYGIVPVIVDSSGKIPVSGALNVILPTASGLALGVTALPVIQDILVSAAARMVTDAGLPQRSTKVTSGEAA
ncbi:MAG: aminotransferase [Marinosulfonomonas sp.]|nr:aminotransferase [Marinosulfonomonas sp.]